MIISYNDGRHVFFVLAFLNGIAESFCVAHRIILKLSLVEVCGERFVLPPLEFFLNRFTLVQTRIRQEPLGMLPANLGQLSLVTTLHFLRDDHSLDLLDKILTSEIDIQRLRFTLLRECCSCSHSCRVRLHKDRR